MKYRDYQLDIINKGTKIINEYGLVYLAMEVRTGKTLTALGICEKMGVKRVLFLTKKKAIPSIKHDYELLSPNFELRVINYESSHKIDLGFYPEVIIADESHGCGSFPKPSKRAKLLKADIKTWAAKVILMSGTPTPESFSQMYHQVYGCPNNPFKHYKNFYAFANDYVNKKTKYLGSHQVIDYSNASNNVIKAMEKYTINYTQKAAGFKSTIEEEILTVPMNSLTYNLCNRLKRDRVIDGENETILADTGVKLMQKLHQMYSGTIIFESKKSMVLDTSKADFIKKKFAGKKIGIFYKFKAELEVLKKVYADKLCLELDDFNTGNFDVIALQIVSGREGISLRKADYIVYYNIDFSATSYWQSRDRMTTKDRLYNKVYWVFSQGGIEHRIYNAVLNKRSYTLDHFKKDLQLWDHS
tara:strand:+ start:6123 stop:7367 length:1245 start_codon:yes stop_codon:yes gene_type:complete